MKNLKETIYNLIPAVDSKMPFKIVLGIFLICLFEFLIVFQLVPASWMNPDDYLMNGIASGAVSGQPSEYLLFTNIVIGYLLKFIFTIVPTVNWYTLYYVSLLFISYYALQLAFTSSKLKVKKAITIHIALLAILYFAMLYLHFTRIGFVAVFAGISTILFSTNTKSKFITILGAVLIILGSLTRFELLFMALSLMAPFFIVAIIKKQYAKLTIIIVSITVAVIFIGIDHQHYKNNAKLNSFKTYNNLRGTVTPTDNPEFTFNEKQTIWNKTDYNIATNFLMDIYPDKFSAESLVEIIEQHKQVKDGWLAKAHKTLSITITAFKSILFRYWHYYLALVLIMGYFLVKREFYSLFTTLGLMCYTLMVAWFLILFKNGNINKEYVLWSFTLTWYVTALLLLKMSLETTNHTGTFSRVFILLIFIISASVIVRYSRGVMKLNNSYKLNNEILLAETILAQNDSLYVDFCYPKIPPFKAPYSRKNEYMLTWFAGSPWNREKIERFANKSNIGIYTLENKNIVIYGRDNIFKDAPATMIQYYRENYDSVFVNVDTISINMQIELYRFDVFYTNNRERKHKN